MYKSKELFLSGNPVFRKGHALVEVQDQLAQIIVVDNGSRSRGRETNELFVPRIVATVSSSARERLQLRRETMRLDPSSVFHTHSGQADPRRRGHGHQPPLTPPF